MFRMKTLSIERAVEPFSYEDTQMPPRPEIESFLDGKNLVINEISIHLMKDASLFSEEFVDIKNGFQNPSLKKLNFPYDYPTLKHPNTLLALRGSRDGIEANYDF
jgi:hypothetical protein